MTAFKGFGTADGFRHADVRANKASSGAAVWLGRVHRMVAYESRERQL
jgi:hypothetical protein